MTPFETQMLPIRVIFGVDALFIGSGSHRAAPRTHGSDEETR